MTRRLGWFLLVLTWSAMASAGSHPGKLSGYVRDTKGVAQMGAAIEVTQVGTSEVFRAFTDTHGSFAIAGLRPGKYDITVNAPSFLPSMTQNLVMQSGASLVMNITLNTLFEAVTLLPDRKKPTDDQDDWKWTLRSMANRPILRVVNGAPTVVREAKKDDDANHASVAFIAGSQADGYGASGDYGTSFAMQQTKFASGTISFTGSVAYGGGDPGGVVRAGYRREMADGSRPEIAVIARRFANPGLGFRMPALQALDAVASNTTQLTSTIELSYGADLSTIQFAGREQAFRPFANLDWHLTPNTVVEYRYATSVPNMRNLKGFDTAPTELSEGDPRVTLVNGRGVVEKAAHQEISVSQRIGKNSLQVAAFADHIDNTELTGVGNVDDAAGNVLPDFLSGTFSYNGGNFSTSGMRIVFERKLPHNVTATMDYAFGGVLDLRGENISWSDVHSLLAEHRSHALTTKISGTLPGSQTHLIASYRWTYGSALTAVDMFNVSPGEADPYLNIFVRQPLPRTHFIPGRMEAVVDVRNLLAQGYIPMMSCDGNTVYLVQSARSVRGGVAFTF
jgi:Carboxypeptidase regulatory-like domain